MRSLMGERTSDWILEGERRVFVYANTKYEWAIGLRAKIDTGADTSSIDIALAQALGLEEIGRIGVRNSNGREIRTIYSASVKFEGEIFDLTLTGGNRSELEFPMIIGRDLLQAICLFEEE